MENIIALNFHLDIENSSLSLSLMREALDRLEELEEAGIPVEFFELRAGNPKPGQSRKKIYIKIDSSTRTFTDTESAPEWLEAFDKVFDRVFDRFLCCREEEKIFSRN